MSKEEMKRVLRQFAEEIYPDWKRVTLIVREGDGTVSEMAIIPLSREVDRPGETYAPKAPLEAERRTSR